MKLRLAVLWACLLLIPGCARAPQTTGNPSIASVEASPTHSPTSTGVPASTPGPEKNESEPVRPTATFQASATVTQSPSPAPAGQHDGPAVEKTIQYDPWSLVHDLVWSPDGAWFAVAAGERIFLYHGNTLETVHILQVGAWANEILFLRSKHLPGWILGLAVRDGTLQFWDIDQEMLLVKFTAHNKAATSLASSPDGRYIASSGNDAILRLWEQEAIWGQPVEDLLPAAEMIGGAFAVPAVRFSPDGSLVASIDLQSVRLRDPASTRLVRTLHSDESLFDIAFSSDGEYLVAARNDASLQVWQVESGEQAALWQAGETKEAFLWRTVFSSDDSQVCATSSLGEIFCWSFPDGELLTGYQAHTKAASALAFSPDGKWLATGGLDAAVYVWRKVP